jgi:hypothetical protein
MGPGAGRASARWPTVRRDPALRRGWDAKVTSSRRKRSELRPAAPAEVGFDGPGRLGPAMTAGARVSGWRAFLLVAAVVAAVGGLVVMHHVSVEGADARPGHSMMLGQESPDDRSGSPYPDDLESQLLHLCMAVLTAAAAVVSLVVVAVMAVGTACAALRAAPEGGRPSTRAPPLPTWVRLSSLCVMRN